MNRPSIPESTPTPTDWRSYTPHPAASMWPMATREEYEDLKASIAATGLAVPILKQGPVIIDGRNRLQACKDLDHPPSFEEYRGASDEIVMEIWKRNFARRHLTTAQKAQMLVKLKTQAPAVFTRWEQAKRDALTRRQANLKAGETSRRLHVKPSGRTTAKIAQATGLPKTAIERAERVQRDHPDSADAIIAGEVTPQAVITHGSAAKVKAAKAAGQRAAKTATRKVPKPMPPPPMLGNRDALVAAIEQITGRWTPTSPYRSQELDYVLHRLLESQWALAPSLDDKRAILQSLTRHAEQYGRALADPGPMTAALAAPRKAPA